MFRLPIILVITLRVIFCPILCMGCDVDSCTDQPEFTHSCCCVESEHDTCHHGECSSPVDFPAKCPCHCESGCIGHVTPDLNNRITLIGVSMLIDLTPQSFDTSEVSLTNLIRIERLSHRHDRSNGRSVRLAHASLQL